MINIHTKSFIHSFKALVKDLKEAGFIHPNFHKIHLSGTEENPTLNIECKGTTTRHFYMAQSNVGMVLEILFYAVLKLVENGYSVETSSMDSRGNMRLTVLHGKECITKDCTAFLAIGFGVNDYLEKQNGS